MRGDDSRTDEPYRDEPDDAYDDSSFPYGLGAGWGWGVGWPPVYRDEDDVYDEEEYGDEAYAERGPAAEREDDSWLDEGGISLLLVGGVILFLFPEPITSTIGILLIAAGVVMWMADALT